jgi:acyl-CoA reductase-like NAD-dependent aldehyde dehydrogenase/alcohol dehydrogenase class IV
MMSTPTQLYINGRFVDATGGGTFETRDPGTGGVIAQVANATVSDAEAAVDAAARAFDSGEWSGLEPAARARMLMELADRIQAATARLAMTEAVDSGGLMRRTGADMFAASRYVRAIARYAATDFPWTDRVPGNPNGFIPSRNYVRREPLGVCVGIIPWNFPFLMAVWKIAPAILMGNTVVLKPAPDTPLTALMLAELCAQTSIPAGVVNVIPGGVEVGEALCTDPRVAKIAFTGSTRTGKRVMKLGADTIKKVTLELGGKSPNLILDDAPLDLAVDGALFATFLHSGQVCESGTRLLVPDALHDEVVDRLVERASAIRLGYQMDPRTQMGPVVSAKQKNTITNYIRLGKEEGAECVLGGDEAEVPGFKGHFVPPTIFAGVNNEMTIAREEIFGPVLSVLRYSDIDEAIAIANDSDYGLAAGVWSKDIRKAERVAARIRSGTTWINDYHAFSDMAPFGGYKQSGVGRELGPEGLVEYTQSKHVHVGLGVPPSDKMGLRLLLEEPKTSAFQYSGPTRVYSGAGSLARLDLEVDKLGGTRILVASDAGLRAAGVLDKVVGLLGDRVALVHDEIPQDSGLTVADAIAERARAEDVDLIVAVGGGSVIDTSKLVSVLLTEGGRAVDHVGINTLTRPQTPLIVVPTTAGTGSEVTSAAVIKDERLEQKVFMVDPHLFPRVAILDPELLVTLPPRLTAATGFDALTHAIEAATSRVANPIADAQALHAIRLLARWLPTCVEDGANVEARSQVQVASTLAGFAISSAQVGLVHGMSHAVGARCGVPHGTGNGIILPHVMRFNAPVCAAKLAQVADALGVDGSGKSDEEKAELAAAAVSDLLRACKHPTGLSEVGVTPEVIEECAQMALVDLSTLFNARPPGHPGAIIELYRQAMG